MQVTVHDSVAAFDAAEWNRLNGTDKPFLRHAFLATGESSGCVAPAAGWQPCHLGIRDSDGLRAALPLYEKHHSWGEFVFDWGWAHAAEQAGIRYYPKLVSATPFTPATGRRLLLRDPDDTEAAMLLIDAARGLVDERACSSVHVQFPDEAEMPLWAQAGFAVRKDCQFHWHNRGYADFETFLASFSSSKRKKVRRERRRIAESGIAFRRLSGNQLDPERWRAIYGLTSRTFLERGSVPYYNSEFFSALSAVDPDSLLAVVAEQRGEMIAAAVFLVGKRCLYGRYWGSAGYHDALHFETCYYQGIDYCIEHGVQVFEPGTQGEHKISRGFTPVATWSAHCFSDARLADAVARFVAAEQEYVDRYMNAVHEHRPYRRDGG